MTPTTDPRRVSVPLPVWFTFSVLVGVLAGYLGLEVHSLKGVLLVVLIGVVLFSLCEVRRWLVKTATTAPIPSSRWSPWSPRSRPRPGGVTPVDYGTVRLYPARGVLAPPTRPRHRTGRLSMRPMTLGLVALSILAGSLARGGDAKTGYDFQQGSRVFV
jgi:hypothetical protein